MIIIIKEDSTRAYPFRLIINTTKKLYAYGQCIATSENFIFKVKDVKKIKNYLFYDGFKEVDPFKCKKLRSEF